MKLLPFNHPEALTGPGAHVVVGGGEAGGDPGGDPEAHVVVDHWQ